MQCLAVAPAALTAVSALACLPLEMCLQRKRAVTGGGEDQRGIATL